MSGSDAAILVFLGLLSLTSLGASVWAWRLDRRGDDLPGGWRGRLDVALVPFANRGQLAISLLLTDLFLFFVALQFDEPPGAFRAWTGLALLPLAVLVFTTLRFGRPAFLVPPWARGRGRSTGAHPPT